MLHNYDPMNAQDPTRRREFPTDDDTDAPRPAIYTQAELDAAVEQAVARTWAKAIAIVEQHFHASETNNSRWNAAVLSMEHYLKVEAAAKEKRDE